MLGIKKATYRLGYIITIRRNSDVNFLNHEIALGSVAASARATVDAAIFVSQRKITRTDISWYLPHYSLKTVQYAILSEHLISRAPTDLSNNEKSLLKINVIIEKNWTFDSGVESGNNMPFYNSLGILERSGSGHHYSNRDVFCKPTISRAQCNIWARKYSYSSVNHAYSIENFPKVMVNLYHGWGICLCPKMISFNFINTRFLQIWSWV